MFLLACSLQGAVAEPWWASALHIARQLAAAPQTERPEKWMIKGGAAQVPPLLAADIQKLAGKVLLKSSVHSIKQAGNHVSVHTEKDHIKAKAVVVSMPPHLAGRIPYDPPMPPARDQLTQRVFMGSIMKVVATYHTPFWREDPSTNFTIAFDPATSGPIRTIYDVTPPVEIGGGGSGVLAGFVIEDAAVPAVRGGAENADSE
ncbi:hypothetical protein CEUSTIGMA_g11161.t1 [Chlamydomonas eustigma]|uniref:monoamine oxidase n=1 Tax=Chlamydomonas eustigma TaxID=1157962 RepID=A0A250XL32_9CHLO|nr:hypothetical protein CEUSTIGMA_g11161.t1 [Chlamydomonas eustigma]|eukprot:GAX83736.1 hypothetical protein CEUSTIGMA_g11161.t1 [Chlamydomonas eustigma]